jgi:hypothetical protein
MANGERVLSSPKRTNYKRNHLMKTSIIRLSLLGFIAATVASAPDQLLGQTTNKVPAENKATSPANTEKAAKGGPFHGKLAAVDKVTKTIVVGKRTFQITSETKIKKAGKPATLDDGVVGETVSGYVKPAADGKLTATTINFGPKSVTEVSDKPSTAADKEKQTK